MDSRKKDWCFVAFGIATIILQIATLVLRVVYLAKTGKGR